MELDFAGLFAGVSINIFDFYDLRHVLDNFDDSVEFIDFHDIDEFLAEKFRQSGIHFIVKFGVLSEKFFVVGSQ
jgi:hypothetical protein